MKWLVWVFSVIMIFGVDQARSQSERIKLVYSSVLDSLDEWRSIKASRREIRLKLPALKAEKDKLGLRFEPENDSNAYLTYEMKRHILFDLEVGIARNYAATLSICYNLRKTEK